MSDLNTIKQSKGTTSKFSDVSDIDNNRGILTR